jgi:cellulose synthase/poly-beta-1,6-N-acetylglucosamine synthase-like glycosyltransferase
LPGWAIAEALRHLPEDELDQALRSRILPASNLPGLRLFACFGRPAYALARRRGLNLVAEGHPADFIAAARLALGPGLLREATFGLAQRYRRFSARRRLTLAQIAWSLSGLAATAFAALVLPAELLWIVASLVSGLFFLAVIALRLLCLFPPQPLPEAAAPELFDDELPVYSVLVPLFRETAVLAQLLTALDRLHYPPGRLDIKLILEESDIAMQRVVARLHLPEHIEVIVVPCGSPQTKPRALNYALQFARGELLTIFDAEDVPEPLQLRLAAETFALLPEGVACLQAELACYNANENWLTRQFAIEYATLFGLLLPALASYRLPLPLGGTSNHFRTHVLRRVGAWDPFNVTEDADLGLRLARLGYATATLDASTYEEASIGLRNWLRQRSRWLKGFLQTWLVHMRSPLRLLEEVGAAGFWASQAYTAGLVASALFHPFCLGLTVWLIATGRALSADAGIFATIVAGINLAVLVSGYAVTILAGRKAMRRKGVAGWYFTLATMPIYWLLISLAAWAALWQFIVAPFHWNKTEHGLSSFQARE